VPHVGLIRTALYNWAYARHTGGTFLFRIEDTDDARNTDESYAALLEAFAWLGITTDEGIIAGGEHGPYRQSERRDIYDDILKKMVDAGLAYESFSTREEITARNLAKGLSKDLGYDNADRHMSAEDKAARRAAGVPAVYRMVMPDEDIVFTDLVRGEIRFPAGSTPDFVIARGDGSHLYPFVNAIDDALMEVTHVLRGEDLLPSTPRQIVVYRGLIELGLTDYIPAFGHMPYIMGEGNKKLSKRDPASNLFNLKRDGFIAPGLLNYLALLGWSVAADRDVFDMAEMFDAFDITRVNANPARFDLKKATAINAEHIRLLDDDTLTELLLDLLEDANVFNAPGATDWERGILAGLLPDIKTRIKLLPEVVDYVKPVFDLAFASNYTAETPEAITAINFARTVIASVPVTVFTAAKLEDAFNTAMAANPEITHKTLWKPIRSALTGMKISLPIYALMTALGKTETLHRLDQATA
jgi:glutamyl-tRNA synthetase